MHQWYQQKAFSNSQTSKNIRHSFIDSRGRRSERWVGSHTLHTLHVTLGFRFFTLWSHGVKKHQDYPLSREVLQHSTNGQSIWYKSIATNRPRVKVFRICFHMNSIVGHVSIADIHRATVKVVAAIFLTVGTHGWLVWKAEKILLPPRPKVNPQLCAASGLRSGITPSHHQ